VVLRYAPVFSSMPWDDPVYEDTFRWCDAIGKRVSACGLGRIDQGGYEDGAMTIVLHGPDLEALWSEIEPLVDVLPVLDGSEVWIRQGVAPGVRIGEASRRVWWR